MLNSNACNVSRLENTEDMDKPIYGLSAQISTLQPNLLAEIFKV